MHSTSLMRLFASLCLLVLIALPGCMAKGEAKSPGGGGSSYPGQAPPADAGQAHAMGTQADYSRSRQANRSSAPSSAPAPVEAEAYDGGGRDYEEAPSYDYDDSAVASANQPQRHNPGLGTSYGEHHYSQVTTAPFVRGSNQPDVLLSLWYNDQNGIREAQGAYGNGFDQLSQSSTSDSVFVVSVVDEYGYAMSAAQVGDKRYVVGQPGQRYKLRVQNNSPYRYEVVASVDGLDVIDGDSASFTKRGYIVDPWGSITVDGWRTSGDSVAAFRFSSMEESYAERKGQGRNIGVVGFAFFHERGGPTWQELQRRDNADPFPSRYAEPPPPRRWRR